MRMLICGVAAVVVAFILAIIVALAGLFSAAAEIQHAHDQENGW